MKAGFAQLLRAERSGAAQIVRALPWRPLQIPNDL